MWKIKLIIHLFLKILQRYCKPIVLGILGMHTLVLKKTFVFICRQKSTSSAMLFRRYCKDMLTSYLGTLSMPGYTLKITISTCRRLWYLSACQKYTSSFTYFLKYYILKNPEIWLADSILVHNSRKRILPDMALVLKYQQQY